MREIKLNIWKKWRKEPEEKKKEIEKNQKTNQEKWLNKLELTMERMRKENEERKLVKQIYEEKRHKMIREKKQKQEEILRKAEESKERKRNKKM